MLDIYPFILETITLIRPLGESICRTDPDLARQLKRAQSSIALNVAEGSYSRGRNQAARFHTAMGSAREALACLEVAAALGQLEPLEPALIARFDRIIGTLRRLSQR
ncbi:MAG: four helix bundle protein [Kofleriaceae bacterium]